MTMSAFDRYRLDLAKEYAARDRLHQKQASKKAPIGMTKTSQPVAGHPSPRQANQNMAGIAVKPVRSLELGGKHYFTTGKTGTNAKTGLPVVEMKHDGWTVDNPKTTTDQRLWATLDGKLVQRDEDSELRPVRRLRSPPSKKHNHSAFNKEAPLTKAGLQRGPRGGVYYISKSGRKVYT